MLINLRYLPNPLHRMSGFPWQPKSTVVLSSFFPITVAFGEGTSVTCGLLHAHLSCYHHTLWVMMWTDNELKPKTLSYNQTCSHTLKYAWSGWSPVLWVCGRRVILRDNIWIHCECYKSKHQKLIDLYKCVHRNCMCLQLNAFIQTMWNTHMSLSPSLSSHQSLTRL